MALAASPPPSMDVSDALDDEIAQVRAETQDLTRKRKTLTSSLLASTKVQARLNNGRPPRAADNQSDQTIPLDLADVKQHSQSNTHRLAFGVTSFPFTDPSPEIQSKNPLLGIRIDVSNRHGKFDSPYYMFCMRACETGHDLRIHRHTIPAFVPVLQYEKQYLPSSSTAHEDEGYGGSDDSVPGNGGEEDGEESRKQDLHGLVTKVRYDLVSWRLRQDAADWLREELGLVESGKPTDPTSQDKNTIQRSEPSVTDRQESENATGFDEHDNSNPDTEMQEEDDEEAIGRFDVISLTNSEVDARQLRIVWADDSLGLLKISDDGKVAKAVVIGEGGNRVRDVERILMGDGKEAVSVHDLLERLEKVYKKSMENIEVEVEVEVIGKEKGIELGARKKVSRQPRDE